MPPASRAVPPAPNVPALAAEDLRVHSGRATGFVFLRAGTRGDAWYAKYRLPGGRQVKRRIGPAWAGRGRPPAGLHTQITAQVWLDEVLRQAELGTLPGPRRPTTFRDACEEYLRWLEHDRQRKPSTLSDYRSIIRSHLLPAFGALRIERIAVHHVEAWQTTLGTDTGMSNRTKVKILTVLYGVMERARAFTTSPTTRLPRSRSRPTGSRTELFDAWARTGAFQAS